MINVEAHSAHCRMTKQARKKKNGVCGELGLQGWVWSSPFPVQNQSHPKKIYLLWEKVAQVPLFFKIDFFLGWVGLGLGNSSVS